MRPATNEAAYITPVALTAVLKLSKTLSLHRLLVFGMAGTVSQAPVTDRLYYKDTRQQRCSANVLSKGSDAAGSFVVLDRTLFHPQGRGFLTFAVHNTGSNLTRT